VSVLLRGECGTGKELFAHAIHHESDRKDHPFIRVNCASLTDTLLESELFGYGDGAFTGAKKGGRKGYFEEATGGTLFLDEIGAMGPDAQARLLRALQEGEIIRVGESRSRQIDVRIIAATNADLEKQVEHGLFRSDLYYRLNVFPIQIPQLAEIKSDIPLLANYFVSRYALEYGRNTVEIAPSVFKKLKAYDWPGNIRELQNVMARAVINLDRRTQLITEEHLVMPAAAYATEPVCIEEPLAGSLKELHQAWEKKILEAALSEAGGNKAEAARTLDISIRNLYNKLHQHKMI
jgi:transcriptional regulator with PAS, ATPase and Fis domain